MLYLPLLALGEFAVRATQRTSPPVFFSLVLSLIHAELVIRPGDSPLTRDQYKSFIALCTGEASDRIIAWRSPQQKEISENDNAR